MASTNWAGNYTYRARRIEQPGSLPELQALVAGSDRIRALGTGHSFTSLPDSAGDLVRLDALPADVDIDSDARSVSVSAAVRYGDLAVRLHRQGWALANLASLPHISVAGAVATGTHGSGDGNQTLSAAVRALDIVGPEGDVRTVRRGDPEFAGSVVALGALGIVTRVVLDLEPTFDVASTQYVGLDWDAVETGFEDVMAVGHSVSLFTRWAEGVDQVWVKSRSATPGAELFGAQPAGETLHMLLGASPDAITQQQGVPGPWQDRLPHFRMSFTPSRGDELQSEFFLPRHAARAAFAELRGMATSLAPALQMSEIRTVAADDLWLSGCYQQDSVAVHFTWVKDEPAVAAALTRIEAALLPLGARPHWGKCFNLRHEQLQAVVPRLADFALLRSRVDPHRKFSNDLVDALIEGDRNGRSHG